MNKTAYEIMKMTAVVKEEVKTIKTPFLCVHGSDDKVTLPAGSEYLFKNSALLR